MPVGADFGGHCDVDDATAVVGNRWDKALSQEICAVEVYIHGFLQMVHVCFVAFL